MKNLRKIKNVNVVIGVFMTCLLLIMIACSDYSPIPITGKGIEMNPSEKPIVPFTNDDVIELGQSEEFSKFVDYQKIIGPLLYKRMNKLKGDSIQLQAFTLEWATLLKDPQNRKKSDAIAKKLNVHDFKLEQFNSIVVDYVKATSNMFKKFPNLRELESEQVNKAIEIQSTYTNQLVSNSTSSINGGVSVCVECPGMNCAECINTDPEDPTHNPFGDPGNGGRCRHQAQYDHCVNVAIIKEAVAIFFLTWGEIGSGGTATPAYIMAINAISALTLIDISECYRQYCH